MRRTLCFNVSAKFQYASKTLRGPTWDQSPIDARVQKQMQNGYKCQTDDSQEIGTSNDTCFVEAKV